MPPPESRSWLPLGANHRYFVDRDIIHWQAVGELTLQDVAALQQLMSQVRQSAGSLLLVCEISTGVSVGPQVRRAISQWDKSGAPSCPAAILGANRMLRTLVMLVMNAARLLIGKSPPWQFFATEQAAYAWLAEQRQRLASEQRG